MAICYIGLGSNLRSPKRQLRQATQLIKKIPRTALQTRSCLYFSNPLGVRSQPMFYNKVIAIQTRLSPLNLLHCCKKIEQKQGRIHKKKWGARILDIDLLLYGNKEINTHRLCIPHSEMLTRDFVLVPLLEIAPNAQLPDGQAISPYLKNCKTYLTKKNSIS